MVLGFCQLLGLVYLTEELASAQFADYQQAAVCWVSNEHCMMVDSYAMVCSFEVLGVLEFARLLGLKSYGSSSYSRYFLHVIVNTVYVV